MLAVLDAIDGHLYDVVVEKEVLVLFGGEDDEYGFDDGFTQFLDVL